MIRCTLGPVMRMEAADGRGDELLGRPPAANLDGRFDRDGHDAVFGACHVEKLGLRDYVIRHATNPIERAFRKMRFI